MPVLVRVIVSGSEPLELPLSSIRSWRHLTDKLKLEPGDVLMDTGRRPVTEMEFSKWKTKVEEKESVSLLVNRSDTDGVEDFQEMFEPRQQVKAIDSLISEIDYKTVFSELIENALEAARAVQEPQVTVTIDSKAKRIVVQDNGYGMDEHTLKRAVSVGDPKNRSNQQTLCDPLQHDPARRGWQSAEFGRYGIGLICAFKFGEESKGTVLTIESKSKSAEGMNCARLDWGKMISTNAFECAITRPPASEDLRDQGTRVIIDGVDQHFFAEWQRSGALWRRELAAKYWLYLVKPAIWGSALHLDPTDNPHPVSITMDDTKTLGTTEPAARIELGRVPGNPVAAVMAAHLETLHKATAGLSDKRKNQVELHRWLQLQVADHRQHKAMVHVLLYYFPVQNGKHTTELLQDYSFKSEGVPLTLQTFWQELKFQDEMLDGKGWFPALDPKALNLTAKERRFMDRVRGFMFVDTAFEPTSHKSRLANKDLYEELKRGTSNEMRVALRNLGKDFRAQLMEWHKKYDRETEFIGPFEPIRKSDGNYSVYRWLRILHTVEAVSYTHLTLPTKRIV
eukprot:TRINITY_DN3573_c0_g2_i2.p1 TRINITY_DN3573_c0_g2~~TRINITY_DN3573_c0_g2_i2.p1  ORF type:complete len:566 (-),score=133.11 TRINITY_DN3573_c0_g2_i2:101-1798(-)